MKQVRTSKDFLRVGISLIFVWFANCYFCVKLFIEKILPHTLVTQYHNNDRLMKSNHFGLSNHFPEIYLFSQLNVVVYQN